MCRVFQATVYLLEKLDVLLGKASEEETKSEILPMIFSTLESNSIQGQVEQIADEMGGVNYRVGSIRAMVNHAETAMQFSKHRKLQVASSDETV